MKIITDADEQEENEVFLQKDTRVVVEEKDVKYRITDGDGDVWDEYLSHDEVRQYHRLGYKLERIYWWQFWKH